MKPDEKSTISLTNLDAIARFLVARLESNEDAGDAGRRIRILDPGLERHAAKLWKTLDWRREGMDESDWRELNGRSGRWGIDTIVSLAIWIMGQREIMAYRQMEADIGAETVEQLPDERFARIWQAYDPGSDEAYLAWRDLLWEAIRALQTPPQDNATPDPVPELSALFEVVNSALYFKLREALAGKHFTVSSEEPWPGADLSTENRRLRAMAHIRPDQPIDSEEKSVEWQRRVADHVMEMDDLTVDVFDIITGVWLQRARTPETLITLSADDFLRLRGLKAQKSGAGRRGGYRAEWRRLIARHIAILANTWVRVLEMDTHQPVEAGRSNSGPVRWAGESRAITLAEAEGVINAENLLETRPWRLRPGDVFSRFLFGSGRQTALLSQKALTYDPVRQQWEKRLIRYLAWQWRIRQGRGEYLTPFHVSTLLRAAGTQIDPRNPGRTRERLEKALDTLMSDHIITGWQYVEHTDEEITGKKGWWRRWIGWKITVEPPQTVMDHYTRIKVREPRKQTLSPPPEASILRETRLARGLTQMQAAEEIGVSQSLLSQIERGGKPRLAPATTRKIKKWMAGPA